ncbi:BTAD domain-containing putative transcriptional regulator [Paenibacillus filicis]|uniref:BTAD domain-containing putative transcriptional regulator n=1 Tax=Paenibacillus gyeongsangnamensis TaxID=3388067 RepID=A0ABT4Q4X4_9BACL|nr:BTAD domain-containing putative transcriptional regulator [Paenibacillus filicis]MCZ8511925.1 BTAD domain-containing putative transcriptional regulator [Paenibacillus filicis]
MADNCIQLLGCLKITIDDKELTTVFSGSKVKLLAYLLLTFDMPQSRKQIAFDFWPDSTEKQTLSNLRKLLHNLRGCHPKIDRYLKITPSYIHWNDELPFISDVREFEQAAKGKHLCELRKAEELYKGELLPGFNEEWLDARRKQLAQTYLNMLDKLISILESQREYPSAIFYANKLLVRNQLSEETYRMLMRLHALNKDMAGVAQIYRRMHRTWQEELGIGPAEETVQLLERLMQNGFEPSTAAQNKLIGRTAKWGTF